MIVQLVDKAYAAMVCISQTELVMLFLRMIHRHSVGSEIVYLQGYLRLLIAQSSISRRAFAARRFA